MFMDEKWVKETFPVFAKLIKIYCDERPDWKTCEGCPFCTVANGKERCMFLDKDDKGNTPLEWEIPGEE